MPPYRDRLEDVNVEVAGMGQYFAKHLEDLGYPVRFVNVGERSSDPERYANRKAEFYWGLRQRFQAGDIAGLTDERTVAQLAGIRYRHTARGQIEIERKEDARKRGVKSPDRAEAVMLALARPVTNQFLSVDEPPEDVGRLLRPYDRQLRNELPFDLDYQDRLTCADCSYLRRDRSGGTHCALQHLTVTAADIGCEWLDPAPSPT